MENGGKSVLFTLSNPLPHPRSRVSKRGGCNLGGWVWGYNLLNIGVGVGINIGEWEEGVWANADGEKLRGH